MINVNRKTKGSFIHHFGLTVTLAAILVSLLLSGPVSAQGTKQKVFNSPDEAFKAMVAAVKARNRGELTAILGPGGKNVFFSGDAVADRIVLDKFATAYEEKNSLERINGKKAILHVGKNEWPLPIPVVKKGNGWRFDTKAGQGEILQRRIGKNELNAIKTCQAYVDAQREYAAGDYDGDGLFEYARQFMSTPGKKDGLYWETKEGEQQSPLGAFVAAAAREGYAGKKVNGKPVPYFGYYYRILEEQGPEAPGGAYSYLANGKMIGGFALVAYPAQYGNSGIMTFIVNKDGLVYQKDFGRNTARIAPEMKAYNPDRTWKKAE